MTISEFDDLAAGTYEWSVKDSLGCISTSSVQVLEPAGIHILLILVILCCNILLS